MSGEPYDVGLVDVYAVFGNVYSKVSFNSASYKRGGRSIERSQSFLSCGLDNVHGSNELEPA